MPSCLLSGTKAAAAKPKPESDDSDDSDDDDSDDDDDDAPGPPEAHWSVALLQTTHTCLLACDTDDKAAKPAAKSDSDSDSESAQKDPSFLFQCMSITNGDIAVVSFSGSVRGSLSSVSTPIQFCYK